MKACVKRGRNRQLTVRLVYGECAINVVSAFATQTRIRDEENEEFWGITRN